ncbi:conserved hypothetical protein [Catenulispora acidiphila DSM 44928]|uniref:Uncharacterized protein n=1 Tax=Catenulispora acidiphila (strain DSM 44928 / JCM 14897 / NBRC 102108 / NRRL B-24433 / ID139908) TaxID=479433 RepID=C7Q9G1_CATAD|nr:hypothetical protein [Catenulispora acidiphila]ACU74307.1 conserved hypothetical protein [Catenulispora acidiphila DSM 44928]
MNSWINLTALWKIVVIGLLAGAGLPALFALGLRALNPRSEGAVVGGDGREGAAGAAAAATAGRAGRAGPLGATIAVLCFAAVLAAMGWGIYSIVHNS